MHSLVWRDSMYNFGFGCGWFGPFLMIVLWGLAIAGAVFIIKSLFSRKPEDSVMNNGPLEVLKTRYAKGEIDREEFLKRKSDLGY